MHLLFAGNKTSKIDDILKVQSIKLYNNKYMIPSTQIPNTEVCAFIVFLVFKLFGWKGFFIKRKDN